MGNYPLRGCTYLWGMPAVGGRDLPSVLAETRWLETTSLKASCGVKKSCLRFSSLELIKVQVIINRGE